MLDKNGIELRTGDIVKIDNAYFKNDCGYWFIARSPGDPNWSGSDYSLHKIGKRGKISTSSHNIAFWPLLITVNDPWKKAAAKEHNKANATIEIVNDIDPAEIIAHFEQESRDIADQAAEQEMRFGKSEISELYYKCAEFYKDVVDRISGEADPDYVKQSLLYPVFGYEFTKQIIEREGNK